MKELKVNNVMNMNICYMGYMVGKFMVIHSASKMVKNLKP